MESMRQMPMILLISLLCINTVAHEPTKSTLTGLAIQFEGVSALSKDSLQSREEVIKHWFKVLTRDITLRRPLSRSLRRLQVYGAWGSDPLTFGLANVTASYKVTGQATSEGGATTIYFDQEISFLTRYTADSAAVVAKLPFGYEKGKLAYFVILEREVVGFETVGKPFSTSPINDTSTASPTNETSTDISSSATNATTSAGDETDSSEMDDEGGIAAGAIVGIILAAAYVGVILLCFVRMVCSRVRMTTMCR